MLLGDEGRQLRGRGEPARRDSREPWPVKMLDRLTCIVAGQNIQRAGSLGAGGEQAGQETILTRVVDRGMMRPARPPKC